MYHGMGGVVVFGTHDAQHGRAGRPGGMVGRGEAMREDMTLGWQVRLVRVGLWLMDQILRNDQYDWQPPRARLTKDR